MTPHLAAGAQRAPGCAREGSRDGRCSAYRRDQRSIRLELEDAVKLGIEHANVTLRNVRSAWVKEQRVEVENQKIVRFQVNLLVTYIVDQ